MKKETKNQIKRLGLEIDSRILSRKLHVAEQQLVEIAKSLTLNAELLILDEPTAALGEKETIKLFEVVNQLKSEGISFIYISHRLEEIAQIADKITVLRDGHYINTHAKANVPLNTLIEEMVGRKIENIFPEIYPISSDKKILEVKNLSSVEDQFNDISFDVKEGEIFGIAGIVGAGRSEVVRAISGADQIKEGQIILEGEELKITHPQDAIQKGIVMVPEDRKLEGLLLSKKILDNLTLPNLDLIMNKRGWIKTKDEEKYASPLIDSFGVKGKLTTRISQLSGGNQQKVLIAKWVSRNPKVIILDEPTRGVDVGARNSIYTIIRDLAKKGMSIIVVSSELEEVIGLSHRIMVLSRGNNNGILEKNEIDSVKIMELATK